MKLFSVNVQWGDDTGDTIHTLIAECNSWHNLPIGYSDEQIFFYGMNENNVRNAVASGELYEDEWRILELYEVIEY